LWHLKKYKNTRFATFRTHRMPKIRFFEKKPDIFLQVSKKAVPLQSLFENYFS